MRSTRLTVQRASPVARSTKVKRSVEPSFDSTRFAMSRMLVKKSVVSVPGLSVRMPTVDPPAFAPSARMPPTNTVISGAVRPSSCARSSSNSSADWPFAPAPSPIKLRNPSAFGSRKAKESTSVCSAVASTRPPTKGTSTETPAAFAAASIATTPARTMTSASDTGLADAARTSSSAASVFSSCDGSLTGHERCGSRRMRAPLAPPRLSVVRKVDADAHAVRTRSACGSPLAAMASLSAARSAPASGGAAAAGSGSIHSRSSLGTSSPRNRERGPMSRCVSLYQALAKAVANSSGFS
mmetsp:Transcript_16306/g.51030  ORF Transcript_16306/g.51030 Transcript_16306/m.51030 type:complete len:297 (+) Transcript_16306:214-1104(+)